MLTKGTLAGNPPSVDDVRAYRDVLAKEINRLREECQFTQAQLAEAIGRPQATVGKYINNGDVPPPGTIVAIARALKADARRLVLLGGIQRAALKDEPDSPEAIKLLCEMLTELTDAPVQQLGRRRTLANFPAAFNEPFVVIVGDRREDGGKKMTPADFGALSASPADLRFLDNLRLPHGYQIISDKIFILAPLDELRRRFANATLIICGSPASNHAARIFNRYSLHRFSLPQDYYYLLENLIKEAWTVGARGPAAMREGGKHLSTSAPSGEDGSDESPDFFVAPEEVPGREYWKYEQLKQLQAQKSSDLRWQKNLIFNGGFIDPAFNNVTRGIRSDDDRDFGIITLAQNPFRAENDAQYPAVFLGGYHLPGTCYALHESIWKHRETFFARHPYGGVLRTQLAPIAEWKTNYYTFYDRIEHFTVNWDDDSEYEASALLAGWANLKNTPSSHITAKEAARAHAFLSKLMS